MAPSSAARSAGSGTCSIPNPSITVSSVVIAAPTCDCDRAKSPASGGLPSGAPGTVHGPSPVSKPSGSTSAPSIVSRVWSTKTPAPPLNGSVT